LSGPEVTCEVIADGVHVHPRVIHALWRLKGAGGICLVTDAVAAAGMPEGEYELGGRKVTLKGGAGRLADGTLAGRGLTLGRAVGDGGGAVGGPVPGAAAVAALPPARAVGLAGRKGSLRVGKDADVAILDHDFQCVATFVKGRAVFDKAH